MALLVPMSIGMNYEVLSLFFFFFLIVFRNTVLNI